jgi:UDP-N-acetyl-D-glucosamine dehydrogenase
MSDDIFLKKLSSIRTKQARIGVIGLGYVGLPLVRIFVEAGFAVTGFDCDQNKVRMLNSGQSYIGHITSESVQWMLKDARFHATANQAELSDVDAILICVPTPLNEHHEPDMSFVISTAESIRDNLRPGQLIILESTTYPGTLRDVVLPILEQSGLKAGVDFYAAYSPEREDPGNPEHTASKLPKVVGGLNAESHELAKAVYEAVVPQVVSVSSPEIAEACKILENTYRCVNIALVNELKMLFERMGIDVWEVIRAASTKPFGFQAFYPGPGLGGHCIPVDPFYLSWVARQFNFHTRFIELAGEINTAMPEYVVQRVALALNSRKKPVHGSKILVLGVAYKKDVDDPRESPSFELMTRLLELGADVIYNDPHIPSLPRMRNYDLKQTSQELSTALLQSCDCVLIATDHSTYDWAKIVADAPLVVDARGATKGIRDGREKIWTA